MQSQLAVTSQNLPIFLFPQNITFHLDEQSTHKQVLTLYNPYDFALKFKVLCTAPNKYKVRDPEGTINARCCVDLVIRHMALTTANCNIIDKFRIQMQDLPSKQAIGKKDVEAKLVNGVADTTERATPDHEMFQQLAITEERQQSSYTLIGHNNKQPNKSTSKTFPKTSKFKYNLIKEQVQEKSVKMSLRSNSQRAQYVVMDKGEINYVALTAVIIGIIALLLPTEGEPNYRLPIYLHLSVNLKLVFAFVLGMATLTILRL